MKLSDSFIVRFRVICDLETWKIAKILMAVRKTWGNYPKSEMCEQMAFVRLSKLGAERLIMPLPSWCGRFLLDNW